MAAQKEECVRIEQPVPKEEEQKDNFCYIKIDRRLYITADIVWRLIRDIFRFSIKFAIMYLIFKYVLHI